MTSREKHILRCSSVHNSSSHCHDLRHELANGQEKGGKRYSVFTRQRNEMNPCEHRCTRQQNPTQPNVSYYIAVPVNCLRALTRYYLFIELAQICCQKGSLAPSSFHKSAISLGASRSEASSTKSQPFNFFCGCSIPRWFAQFCTPRTWNLVNYRCCFDAKLSVLNNHSDQFPCACFIASVTTSP
jgi:hypothetical protein